MAKIERRLRGDFYEILNTIHNEILNGSISASYEDGSEYRFKDTYVATRVYERYSYFGGNRVSLTVTLISCNSDIYLTAITSGGSQAVFFKINTVGENAFLEKLEKIVATYSNP